MKKIYIILIIFLIIPITVGARSDKINVTFSKCVDGDTAKFIYKNKELTVRLLAVDTPETKHPTKKEEPFGKEASDYTCNKITNGKNIILEFDANSTEFDKYDRYLVWAWVDDRLLQEELISNGYAKVDYLYGDYKYTEDLQKLETIAKGKKIGVWSEENPYNQNIVFIIVGVILLIVLLEIINRVFKNKEIRKITKSNKNSLKKELDKLIKKI